MKYLKSNLGITLIELLVSISISFCIILIIHAFIFRSVQGFRQRENEIEVQYEVQTAMDEFIHRLSLVKKITFIQDDHLSNVIDTSKECEVRKIILDGQWIFEFKPQYQSMSYGEVTIFNKRANVQYANYITAFILQPLPEGKTYRGCKGLQIKITSKKQNSEVSIENVFYFP